MPAKPPAANCDYPCQSDAGYAFDQATIQENLYTVTGVPGEYYAHMGWVGFANLKCSPLTPEKGTILRVTSADINLKQEITTPDVIDGRIDRTVYQLGPKIVEGTLSMPVVADVDPNEFIGGCVSSQELRSGTAASLLNTIWCWTTARSAHGRLQWSEAELKIRYANHSAFTFSKCIVNTLSMKVAQSDVVSLDINVIGASRARAPIPTNPDPDGMSISDFLSPARVLTWNDVTISGVPGCGTGNSEIDRLFGSGQVREFSFEINNNAERFFSLNGRLFPVDINVAKREITGSLKLLGLQDRLRERAEAQQDNFTRKDEIRMMFFIGDDAGSNSRDWFDQTDTPSTVNGAVPFFWKKFHGVIFRIEEMSLTNSVYETTVNWLSLGSDQEGYQSISPASSCDFPSWS